MRADLTSHEVCRYLDARKLVSHQLYRYQSKECDPPRPSLFSPYSLCVEMARWSITQALYDALIEYPELCQLPGIQAVTNLQAAPWDEANPIAIWSEENTLPAIMAFNANYKDQGAEDRRRALVKRNHVENQEGRDAVLTYLRTVAQRWKVRVKILACLSARGVGSYAVMRSMKVRTVSVCNAGSAKMAAY